MICQKKSLARSKEKARVDYTVVAATVRSKKKARVDYTVVAATTRAMRLANRGIGVCVCVSWGVRPGYYSGVAAFAFGDGAKLAPGYPASPALPPVF